MDPVPSTTAEQDYVDPVTEAYKPGIDRTILRHNLRLTPDQRLDSLAEHLAMIEACRAAGEEHRRAQRK
jgi:hypothetical protein